MKTDLFDYRLPKDSIAQKPAKPRDHSRLLALDRATGNIRHKHFYDILDELNAGDLLIANESKVFKARLTGHIQRTADDQDAPLHPLPSTLSPLEIFLLRPEQDDRWIALAKPGKKLRINTTIVFDENVTAIVKEKRAEDGTVIIAFNRPPNDILAWTDRVGDVPVPPYVASAPADASDYQTVYAKHVGSVAAPTAGFHFTPELMEKIRAKGIRFETITLHVGLGTFRPVQTDDLNDHIMHEEWVSVPERVRDLIEETRANGHRAIAVGTTTMRALESGLTEGFTNIFIKPGHHFTWADGLITNFHLPKSTLLVLVSAFIGEHHADPDDGRKMAIRTYEEAIRLGYRFYSFGDAMLITG